MNTSTALEVIRRAIADRRPKQKATTKKATTMIDPLEVLALSARAREVAELDRQLREFLPQAAVPEARYDSKVFAVPLLTPEQARAKLAAKAGAR
jgi:hypothetical protein